MGVSFFEDRPFFVVFKGNQKEGHFLVFGRGWGGGVKRKRDPNNQVQSIPEHKGLPQV